MNKAVQHLLSLGFGLISWASPGIAQDATTCRLALALAMDVSRSVDAEDFRLQINGTIAALRDPGVQAAFFGPTEVVALTIYHWAGSEYQVEILPWTLIEDPAALEKAIAALNATEHPFPMNTGLGNALNFGLDRLAAGPDCRRRVLDMAGDGQNNQGPPPARIYKWRGEEAVTVNALAIGEHESGLAGYFTRELIRGPGAFVEIAARQEDFPAAMRRKLLRELVDQVAGGPYLLPDACAKNGSGLATSTSLLPMICQNRVPTARTKARS
jgi:hypothetical protein